MSCAAVVGAKVLGVKLFAQGFRRGRLIGRQGRLGCQRGALHSQHEVGGGFFVQTLGGVVGSVDIMLQELAHFGAQGDALLRNADARLLDQLVI